MPHPRLHHRLTGCLAAATLLALCPGLAGCSPDSTGPEDPTPTNSDTATQLPSDSEGETLAVAEDAYRNYLHAVDAVMNDGGTDPDRIDPFTTGPALDAARDSFKTLREEELHTTGETDFFNVTLVSVAEPTSPETIIELCKSVKNVDVLDVEDDSVIREDRDPFIPTRVIVQYVEPDTPVVASQIDAEAEGMCER